MESTRDRRSVSGYGSRARPGNHFELYSWLFMRISGIFLWVLVLGHVFIMHVLNNVEDVDFEFVAGRLSLPVWRIYDWVMLILALIHGLNGVRVMIDDYVKVKAWRTFTVSLIYSAGFIFLVVGSVVLLTFQPPTG